MPVRAFKVEASLLINEGGVQCVPVVFAYPLEGGGDIELGAKPSLQRRAARGARSGAGCEARAGAGRLRAGGSNGFETLSVRRRGAVVLGASVANAPPLCTQARFVAPRRAQLLERFARNLNQSFTCITACDNSRRPFSQRFCSAFNRRVDC